MAPCLRRLLPWLAAGAAACSGHRGPPLRVTLAPTAGSSARCRAASGAPLPGRTLASAQVATLRLSVRRHPHAGDPGNFDCDRVLTLPGDPPRLEIRADGDATVDIYGEAWAAPVGTAAPARLAVGALVGLSFTAETLPELRLYPTEQFACAAAQLARPRAFHSATLLPDGELLIVGGLTTADAGVDTFAPGPLDVAADAEVYDPATGTFVTVREASPAAPRAFHQAALVNAAPPYQILLVGGLTVADTHTPALGMSRGDGSGTRLVPFDTAGALAAPLTTAAATAELLTYDPATKTATRTPFAGFAPAAFQAGAPLGDGLAVVGGIDWMGMPLATTIPEIHQAAVTRALETPRSATSPSARMGATLTPLSDDSALVWGGAIAPADPAGQWLTGLRAGGAPALTPIAQPSAPPTQFHTATAAAIDPATGVATLLVTGGFVQTSSNGGQALEPPGADAAARLLAVTPAGAVTSAAATLAGFVVDPTCADPARYKPAGWEAATPLSRQRVLVSGGAPTVAAGCNDCDGGDSFLCASKQAALFSAPATLARTGALQLPRFGHSATAMPDGNVLVVGGIGSGDGTPRVLRDTEAYDPRPGTPLWDAASGLPDPDDPIVADLTARHQTRAPAAPLSPHSACSDL